MSAIDQLRAALAAAETIHAALYCRRAEALRAARIAVVDEDEARIAVSEARQVLRDAEGYEQDLVDAHRWRAHVAACEAREDRAVEVLLDGREVLAKDLDAATVAARIALPDGEVAA